MIALLAAVMLSAACGRTKTPAEGAETRPGSAERAPAAVDARAPDSVPPPSDPNERVACPVCGLEFKAGEARAARAHGGRTYRFLLEDHAAAFAIDPGRYLDAGSGPE